MYAILETGGKQYRVEAGASLQIEALDAEEGQTVELKPVRFISDDNGKTIGQPEVNQAHIKATVVKNGRTRSIRVFKKKRRKGYRRKQGHRQGYTEIKIVRITLPKGKPESGKVSKPEVVAEVKKSPKAKKTADKPKAAPTDIDITDVAPALAETNHIDLNEIEGSGKDGRILKSDIDKAIKAKEAD